MEDTSSTVDVSSSAASTDATAVDTESNKDDDLAGIELAPPAEGQAKERGAHLSGKINNLLTTDLSTISGSFDIVSIRKSKVSDTTLQNKLTFLSYSSILRSRWNFPIGTIKFLLV